MKQGDKVYFGRSNFEFVGIIVESFLPDYVVVDGVETDCVLPHRSPVTIEYLEGLTIVDDTEWNRLTMNEPAFADMMTRERFIELQHEMQQLEILLADGRETDETDFRVYTVELLMNGSPWTMHPDMGCVLKEVVNMEQLWNSQKQNIVNIV